MPWNVYEKDREVLEEYRQADEMRAEQIERRMGDLMTQMELYDSEGFAFFLAYLDGIKTSLEKQSITESDPVKHAEMRGRWAMVAHLIEVPKASRLEYEELRSELASLRPEPSDTL